MCKVADAMKESKASPVRLISLPYLTLSVNGFCMEVQWNLDITKSRLRMTNDFLYPSVNEIDEKEPP